MNPTANNAQGTNTHSYPAYDYPVGIGTGLVAVKSGTIVDFPGVATRQLIGHLNNTQHWPEAGGGSPNSGNVITISHGNGEYTCYLHDSPFDVNAYRGRQVKQGEIFARSGHNGWSTGPHLHFEVWRNGSRIDPGPWLASIKKEEPVFNDGDRKNLNLYFYGEDKGMFTNQVGKDWKTAMYELFKSGSDFDFEYKVNAGDVMNINELYKISNGAEVRNQNWKKVGYWLPGQIAVGDFVRVNEELYKKG